MILEQALKISDSKLWHLLKAGDDGGYRYLYKNYYPAMCAAAYSYTKDESVSEALVDDVIFHIWQSRDRLDISSSLKRYLLVSVRNKCLEYLRSAAVSRRESIMDCDDSRYHKSLDGGFYFHGEPLGIGGHVSLRIMHSFDPYDELSEPEKQYILGLQCNLWAEYISDFSHVQFMVLPRFCALSENAWSEGKTDYDSFLRRVEKGMLPLYRYFGFNVADYAFNGIE